MDDEPSDGPAYAALVVVALLVGVVLLAFTGSPLIGAAGVVVAALVGGVALTSGR